MGLAQLGRLSTEEAGRLLGTALDGGVNYFDTAECYGNSEENIGNTVAHRRDEIVLATKAGHLSTGSSGQPWTGQTVRESIDRSLVKLKTDHVDLLQIHAQDIWPPLPDEVVRAVLDAKESGKIRFLGYSGENADAEWAVQSGLFDTLLTCFSLADQRARYGLFEQARSRGIGIIAKKPIGGASWGGEPPPHRSNLNLLQRARAMQEMGPIDGAPEDHVVLALGFVLAQEDVHTAIVGTNSPEHMLANIEAVETVLPIAEGVVAELRRVSTSSVESGPPFVYRLGPRFHVYIWEL